MAEKFLPINLDEVEHVVASYVIRRTHMASTLTADRPSHLQFIAFCNAQAMNLNKALGMLNETELRVVLQLQQSGAAPLTTKALDEAFEELLMTLIALLAAKRQQIAGQN